MRTITKWLFKKTGLSFQLWKKYPKHVPIDNSLVSIQDIHGNGTRACYKNGKFYSINDGSEITGVFWFRENNF